MAKKKDWITRAEESAGHAIRDAAHGVASQVRQAGAPPRPRWGSGSTGAPLPSEQGSNPPNTGVSSWVHTGFLAPGVSRPTPRPSIPTKGAAVPSRRPSPRPDGSNSGGKGSGRGAAPKPGRIVTRNGVRAASGGAAGGVTGGSVGKPVGGSSSARRGTGSGSASKPSAAPVDPIKSMVDDIIAGMNSPLDNQKRQVDEQSNGNLAQSNRLSDFYGQQVSGIRDSAHANLNDLVTRAAQLQGISENTLAANQDWLKGHLSGSNGGTQDATVGNAAASTQADLAGANAQTIKSMGDSGQRFDYNMAQQQLAGSAHKDEMARQELLRRQAADRDIEAQKAANLAQAPKLHMDIDAQQRELAIKEAAAKAEWGYKNASLDSLNNYRNGQLAVSAANAQTAAQRLAASQAPKAKKVGRYGNIDPKYDSAISRVYDSLQKPQSTGIKDDPDTKDVDESHGPLVAPWRQAWNKLTDSAGLAPDAAAFLASKWYASSIDSSTPYNIRVMLAGRRVSAGAQRRIIETHFGAGSWAKAQRKPKRPDLLGDTSSAIRGVIS